MRPFWKSEPEQIEKILRRGRATPRDEFASSILARISAIPPAARRTATLRRVGLATALTVVVAAVAAGLGGIGAASAGVSSIVRVATQAVTPSHDSHPNGGAQRSSAAAQDQGDDTSQDGDHHQYKVTICHWANHKYVTISVSPQGAAEHAAHHPKDIVPAPPGGCPK